MSTLLYLIPVALFLGGLSLAGFLWALRSGQYDDLDGAAERVLLADAADAPLFETARSGDEAKKDSLNQGNLRGTRQRTSNLGSRL